MIDHNSVRDLHDNAMDRMDQSHLARRLGNYHIAAMLDRRAYEMESQAARLLIDSDVQPSRAVLFRSAATLALDCGELDDAGKLAREGLNREPPPEIAQELRDLLEKIGERVEAESEDE